METQTIIKEDAKHKIKKPRMFKVLMHNDDFTTMEFVVEVLMTIFNKNLGDANKIMMDVHRLGRGVVGIYPYDVAHTKVLISSNLAKEEGFPFNITMEEV